MKDSFVKDVLLSYETLVRAIAGSTGSVVAMTVFYPLDTVRSRLQLEDRESKGTWKVIRELVKEEGVETLYRGLSPVLKSLWASNFVYFYSVHTLKYIDGNAHGAAKNLLYASIAGVINVLTTTPLWVVSTRLKMDGIRRQAARKYLGLIHGLIKIRREEGIGALWNGTLPSLILVSNPAIQFMVYEWVKRYVQSLYRVKALSATTCFFIGAFSKAVATVLTYPLHLIQTNLRHGHSYKDLPKNAGMKQLIVYILKKHGFAGLFKGMEAKILQTVLTAALMYGLYEKIASSIIRLMVLHGRK